MPVGKPPCALLTMWSSVSSKTHSFALSSVSSFLMFVISAVLVSICVVLLSIFVVLASIFVSISVVSTLPPTPTSTNLELGSSQAISFCVSCTQTRSPFARLMSGIAFSSVSSLTRQRLSMRDFAPRSKPQFRAMPLPNWLIVVASAMILFFKFKVLVLVHHSLRHTQSPRNLRNSQ